MKEGQTLAPRNFWKERDTQQALSFAFSMSLFPCHPHLGKGEMDTYLVVVGFEFSRYKVLSGKMSD